MKSKRLTLSVLFVVAAVANATAPLLLWTRKKINQQNIKKAVIDSISEQYS